MMWRYSTPAWKRTVAAELHVERLDDRRGILAGGVAAGEIDHRAVAVDGDEVAAVGDLIGAELEAQRRGLDRRAAGVEAGRVVAEDRHVADVAARAAGPAGITAARPTRAASAPASAASASTRPRAGVRPPSESSGSSAHPSGTHTTYFMECRLPVRRVAARRPSRPPRRWAARRSALHDPRGRRRCSGSGGRTPMACSTASGNLAGWAVARMTIGSSARRTAAAGGRDRDRGVRIEDASRGRRRPAGWSRSSRRRRRACRPSAAAGAAAAAVRARRDPSVRKRSIIPPDRGATAFVQFEQQPFEVRRHLDVHARRQASGAPRRWSSCRR